MLVNLSVILPLLIIQVILGLLILVLSFMGIVASERQSGAAILA